MTSERKRGSVTPWKGQWRVRLTVEGARKNIGLFRTREEADEVLEAALVQLADRPSGLTLLAWGERWLDRREKSPAHRSSQKDRSRWRTHVVTAPFATKLLRRIERRDVVAWVRELLRTPAKTAKTSPLTKTTTLADAKRTLSRQTVVHALNLLRASLAEALDDDLVRENVADGVRVPRVASTADSWTYLTASEVEELLAPSSPIPEEKRLIFQVAIFTGLRKGELWGLRWADVTLDGDRPELVVRHSYRGPTKSGRVRRVPLLARAREALKRWRALHPGVGHALVFPSDMPRGIRSKGTLPGGCHSASYSAEWERWKTRAGITRRVRFHDLRHTCASHLVMGSWGRAWRLEEVRDWLGHSTITVTERYAHLAPDSIHGAARETDAARRPTDTLRTPVSGRSDESP